MADKSINELSVAQQMTDDAKLVVYQDGDTKSIEGTLIKEYAKESTKEYVEGAANSAKEAAESAASAETSSGIATKSAETAKQYSGNPPQIQDGTWWVWNAETGQYQDTGSPAQGNLLYATFFVDPATGVLCMVTPEEYRGPSFALVGGSLEVTV